MPLVSASMLPDMIEKLSKPNTTHASVWPAIAKAYCNSYLQGGMNAGSGSTTAVSGIGTLTTELLDIFALPTAAGPLTMIKAAKAFNNCLMTYMSVYQTTIVTAAGLPGLINDFIEIGSAPQASPVKFAQGLAKALDVYTKQAVVIGIIPGSPPIPFTGPIS